MLTFPCHPFHGPTVNAQQVPPFRKIIICEKLEITNTVISFQLFLSELTSIYIFIFYYTQLVLKPIVIICNANDNSLITLAIIAK